MHESLSFLPERAKDMRYVTAAMMRAKGFGWKDVAREIGLSRGRCQNLVLESWWPGLMAWASQSAPGDVLAAGTARMRRGLRHLPLESPVGLEYVRLALQGLGVPLDESVPSRRSRGSVDVNCCAPPSRCAALRGVRPWAAGPPAARSVRAHPFADRQVGTVEFRRLTARTLFDPPMEHGPRCYWHVPVA